MTSMEFLNTAPLEIFDGDLMNSTSKPNSAFTVIDLMTTNTSGNCTYGTCGSGENETVFGGNSTDNSVGPPKYWAYVLVLFPLFTLFGNILVVLSVVKEKQLQTMTNYFIVSLAIADLGVALLVMPLAVHVEVMHGRWTLDNDALCDAWVAFDVVFCTASILNLAAISVDRFMAVTRPIKYSRHKSYTRVYITIAITWLISIGIGSPIALGANKTPQRTPDFCIFYNSDFLIWSSLGSFYIPCIVMIILYWRIFKVIHERSKKNLASKNKIALSSNITSAVTKASDSNTDVTAIGAVSQIPFKNGLADVAEEGSSNQTDEQEPDFARSPTIESEIWVRRESFKLREEHNKLKENGCTSDSCVSSPNLNCVNANSDGQEDKRKFLGFRFFHKNGRNGHHTPGETIVYADPKKGEQKTVVKFRFQFHLPKRGKKTKKDLRNSREKKATKTLAIVLGGFLFCWVPFFTMNIINAFCIRYNLTIAACNPDPLLGSTFLWLGYINSFLNPVIYTIFNMEFRKAFKKLLQHPCK